MTALTVSDVLDRGIVAVPDILETIPDGGSAGRDDIDLVVKRAFSDAITLDFDVAVLGDIIAAADPLGRATALIAARYAQLGGSSGVLGTTAGTVTACADGFGYYRHFRDGSIFWHPAAGVHEVHGPIRAKWASLGWERSVLGYPTSDQRLGSDPGQRGAYNTFQGGAIHWYPPGFGPLHIDAGALSVGMLAASASASATLANSVGSAAAAAMTNTFVGEALGGLSTVETLAAVRAAPPLIAVDTGALAVGEFLGKLADIGGRTVVTLPGDRPAVLGAANGAFEVHGEIGIHYRALGGSGGILGYPTTDETGTPDGAGRFNHFQAGSIYWTAATGAHETHGLIRALWAAGGWERNAALGYPISDELVPDRRIGHRFPERKKKVGLPPDVIKFPADAVVSGFSPRVSNLPLGSVLVAEGASAEAVGLPRGTAVRRVGRAAARVDAAAPGPVEGVAAIVAESAALANRGAVGAGRLDVAERELHPGRLTLAGSSSAAAVASENRFGDFENGVLFWRRGASQARQLQPWSTSADGDSMKRSPAQVVAAFEPLLRPALAGLDGADFAGSGFAGCTGYSWDGATVHNRAHRVVTTLTASRVVGGILGTSITVPTTVAVDLRLETAFDPQRRTVIVYLSSWTYADATDLTASPPLLRQLHPRLDGLLFKPADLIEIPDTDGGSPIALLSAKTLADGSVVVYIEPDDPLIVSGSLEHIRDAIGVGVVIDR